jgi:hypothetical protein
MTRVTRELVARESEKIFANSPGFNTQVPMAGRAAPQRKLASIVSGEIPARFVRLSDLFGAGKTFFLDAAVNRLAADGLIAEPTEYLHADFRDLGDFSSIQHSRVRLLAVDELDRKAKRDVLLRTIEAAARWQGEDGRIVILTGDYALKNEDLVSAIGEPETLDLEPLDRVLLIRALAFRLAKALRQFYPNGEDLDAEALEAAESFFDPDLLSVLLPPTDPPVATFREVLGILQKMSQVLPMDRRPAVMTPETFQAAAAVEGTRRRPPAQAEFLEALNVEIRSRRVTGTPFEPMLVHEYPWLSGMSDGDAAKYEGNVIDALIRAKLLLPMGVPYASPSYRRTPGPYLPTVRAFLNATFL